MEINQNPRQSKIQSLLRRLNVLEEKDLVRQVDGLLDEDSRLASERRNPAGMAIRRLAKELAEVKGDKRAQTALDSIDRMEKESGEYRETSKTEFETRLAGLEEALQASEKRSGETSTAKVREVIKYIKEASDGYTLDRAFEDERAKTYKSEIDSLTTSVQSIFGDTASLLAELGETQEGFNKTIGDVSRVTDEKLAAIALLVSESETRLNSRISSIPRGGGNQNRSIIVGGDKDTLSHFTDINLKPGTGITITYAANNATGYTDITIASNGGASGISRQVQTVAVNTLAGDMNDIDYVYLCAGTITLTLPTSVGNNNLYTVKNIGAGIVTINTTGGETIDGDPTVIMPLQYTSIDLISNNSGNWDIT